MLIILIGYPGSQHIVPASRYLAKKYLPGFDIIYFNYTGEINGWSKYLADYFLKLTDKYVIMALDDSLLIGPINIDIYNSALNKMSEEVVCIKLCSNTPEELEEYPVTTQYCIWDREFLIKLLSETSSPWDFEMRGSMIFKTWDKKTLVETCLDYPVNSALSNRWQGVKTESNNPDDIKYLREHNLL